MKRSLLVTLALGIAFFLLPFPAGGNPQEKEKTAAAGPSVVGAFPGEATLVLHVSDMAGLIAKVKKSPLYQLKDRNEFAELRGKVEKALEEARTKVRAELDIDLWEVLDAVQGEVVLLVGSTAQIVQAVKNPSAPPAKKKPGKDGDGDDGDDGDGDVGGGRKVDFEALPVLLAVDGRGGAAKLKGFLGKVFDYGRKEGTKIETNDFHGGKVTVLSNPDAGKKGEDGPENVYVGEHGSKILLSLSRKTLEETIVNLAGGTSGGLATNSIYQATRRATDGDRSDMFVYLDIKQVTNAVGVALGPGPQVFIWETVKGLLLGTSLNSLAIGGFLNEGGLRETMFVHNGGASDGILGWFKGEPFSSSPASVIPAEAATFTSVGINSTNLGTSIRGLIKLAMSFQGQQTDDVDSWVKTQIGIDLGDVFRGLGGRFHLFSTGTVANLENPFEDQNFVLELKDEAPFRQLINKAAEMSGGGWQPKKYLERDIYSVGGSPQEGGPSFCIADRFFLFAGAVEKVEKLIRRLGKDAQGVGENEEYKKMAGSIPQKVNLLSFSNSKYLATYLESITEVLKDSVNDEVPEEVFLLLTAVGKTLGASIGYGVWQDAGLYFESTITYQKN